MAGSGRLNGSEKMDDVSLDTSASQKPVLLHGSLEVWIYEAKALPNMDMVSENARQCFTFFKTCSGRFQRRERDNRHHHKIITSDPYVSIQVAGTTVAQTRVISNNQDPVWNEHFHVDLAHYASKMEFIVKDDDAFGAERIGSVVILVQKVSNGDKIEGWFPVFDSYGKTPKPDSALRLSIQFYPAETEAWCKDGAGAGPLGIPNTYFPLRKGGMVSVYQDAHVADGLLPEIRLDGGKVFEHGKCWEEICHAILEAHHLVYITGWSIYHRVKLVREPTRRLPLGGNLNLGELLKFKSQEGVRVLLLVWDDKTSHHNVLLKTEGVMQTHDEETKRFFKHSSVQCLLAPRYASSKLSWFKQQVVGTLYTHHQKTVIVDSQANGNYRKLTAFVGGLDLCDGRYDTPEHRLFKDLETVYKEDYHNPTFTTNADAHGPRQPWHDLHCKVDGPAAYDILTNFEQRWCKASKEHKFAKRFRKVSTRYVDDSLIQIDRISWILSPGPEKFPDGDPQLWVSKEDDPDNWHVQVFRSIDSGSVKGFPKSVQEQQSQNLVRRKNLLIDKSIHTAYVKAIRSAQHFIYIENQYFVGSSYNWPSYKNAGAHNLIPMEIALKIAGKIRKGERFAVYVVIPMWPEGNPTGASVQEILFWQSQTMEMMYGIIAEALKDAGLADQNPQDYLNFYCLGNREPKDGNEPPPTPRNSPAENSPQGQAQKYRRFMIYVHAKGMIVDDEYVIMGSANINERSLEGSRDTEIAMGSYQPHHTWASKRGHPHGQVYGYRMSLWAEHLGLLDESFNHPESLDCVRKVNELAETYWQQFTAEEVIKIKGHLLKYPLKVEADGKVVPLPGNENFPDVGGKILGAPGNLPDTLTT